MKTVGIIFGVAVLMGAASVANAEPIAELTLTSQPGSFIGAGQNFDITYTPTNSDNFGATVNMQSGGSPDYITFVMGTVTSSLTTNTYATLEFSTVQLGVPLTTGTYDNAQRAAFATSGHPGLDVSFQNRGSNVLTGSFIVTDAEFTGTTIDTFSASFTQDSDNNSSMISGTFTYNANATEVPEPGSLALFGVGLLGLAGLRRRRVC